MQLGACFWKVLEARRGHVSLRCLGTGRRVASCRRSALMCLGKASRRDQGGMQQEMPQVELPWKSHAESKEQGWGGPTLSCLWALNLPQPPLSLHFSACCVLGQQKGLQETLSLPDHTALPPAPQGARLPSRACGFAAPSSLQAGAATVCGAQEGKHSGRRGISWWE